MMKLYDFIATLILTSDRPLFGWEIVKAARNAGLKVDGTRVRRCIHEMREADIPVAADTHLGYYIEPDEQKWRDYLDSLESRVNSQAYLVKRGRGIDMNKWRDHYAKRPEDRG